MTPLVILLLCNLLLFYFLDGIFLHYGQRQIPFFFPRSYNQRLRRFPTSNLSLYGEFHVLQGIRTAVRWILFVRTRKSKVIAFFISALWRPSLSIIWRCGTLVLGLWKNDCAHRKTERICYGVPINCLDLWTLGKRWITAQDQRDVFPYGTLWIETQAQGTSIGMRHLQVQKNEHHPVIQVRFCIRQKGRKISRTRRMSAHVNHRQSLEKLFVDAPGPAFQTIDSTRHIHQQSCCPKPLLEHKKTLNTFHYEGQSTLFWMSFCFNSGVQKNATPGPSKNLWHRKHMFHGVHHKQHQTRRFWDDVLHNFLPKTKLFLGALNPSRQQHLLLGRHFHRAKNFNDHGGSSMKNTVWTFERLDHHQKHSQNYGVMRRQMLATYWPSNRGSGRQAPPGMRGMMDGLYSMGRGSVWTWEMCA